MLHKQVLISYGNLSDEVDEGIADLILELWKSGIVTFMSCQEGPDKMMWIQFIDFFNFQKFLDTIIDSTRDDMRLMGHTVVENRWVYVFNPPSVHCKRWKPAVRFPIADKEMVIERLQNKRKKGE